MKKVHKYIKRYLPGVSLSADARSTRMIAKVCGIILVWCGIWNLADMYLFPDMSIMSNSISIFIGVGLLYLLEGNLNDLN